MNNLSEKNMVRNNQILILFIISIILVSAVVTLFNLGWDKSFIGDDYGVSYHFPGKLIKFYYYTWDRFFAPGKVAVTNAFSFLWGNLVFGLFKTGLNPVLIQRLVYFLFFAISGSGAFFLLTILIRKYSDIATKNAIYLGAFTASLLYMFNHLTMHIVSFPLGPYHLSYMLLPSVLALFIYNLQIKTTFSSIFLFIILFLLMANGNPANTISIVFLLGAYLLFFVRRVKGNSARPILFLSISFILVLFLCSYIYLSFIGIGSNVYGKYAVTRSFVASFGFNSVRTSFLNLFRLAGVNTWPNYPYHRLYTGNGFFIFLGYLLPFLAITSLLIRQGRKVKLFFALMVIAALFFAKGVHPPFEKLFLLVSRIPGFGMYRAVYHKFGFFIVISYSVLIGFLVAQSFIFLKENYLKLRYIVALVPLIICWYNKPFFTKDIVKKDFLTEIPGEYGQLEEVTQEDPSDFKSISVPPAPGGRGLLLQWDNDNLYVGAHPDMFLLNNPVLDSYWFIAHGLTEGSSWGDTEFEDNVDAVLNYTRLLNTKYILLHKDFVERYDFKYGGGLKILNGKLRAKIAQSVLGRQKGIKLIKASKYYDLYQLSNNYFLPHIYSASTAVLVDGDLRTFVPMVETGYLDGKPVLVLLQQKTGEGRPAYARASEDRSAGGQRTEEYLRGISGFVVKDSNWQDLAVELCPKTEVGGQKTEIRLPEKGVYEIYLNVSERGKREKSVLNLKIDGRELLQLTDYAPRIADRRYIKVGETELTEGMHLINIQYQSRTKTKFGSGLPGAPGGSGQKSPPGTRPRPSGRRSPLAEKIKKGSVKIIFVPEEERKEIEKALREKINSPQTEVAYILGRDGEFYVP